MQRFRHRTASCIQIFAQNEHGRPASLGNHKSIVQMLLDKSAKVNAQGATSRCQIHPCTNIEASYLKRVIFVIMLTLCRSSFGATHDGAVSTCSWRPPGDLIILYHGFGRLKLCFEKYKVSVAFGDVTSKSDLSFDSIQLDGAQLPETNPSVSPLGGCQEYDH